MSLRYAAIDVSCPGHSATVLVALACTGIMPMPIIAGKTRNDPPPATAFSSPPRKAAVTSHAQRQSIAGSARARRDMQLLL